MQLLFNLNLAWRAIKTNRLRAILTIAIIGIGIWALVAILTASDVLKVKVNTSFGSMGANTFQINGNMLKRSKRKGGASITFSEGKNISYDEASEFKERYTFPSRVGISVTGTNTATAKFGSEKTNPNVRTVGIDENYLPISDTKLQAGRDFSEYELQSGIYVCILGEGIAKRLFKNSYKKAPGQIISVGDIKYTVVGVMEEKGSSMRMDGDNLVLIPLQNARTLYGGDRSYIISVAVDDVKRKQLAADEAEGLFRNVRKVPIGAESNFAISLNDSLIETLLEIIKYISYAAIVIAIITVLGSVIGLMNIMLVSVAERTREIGVSKALGAKTGVIKAQFLTESVIISLLGGGAGIVLGIATGNLVGIILDGAFVVPWLWMMMAVTLCGIVGILSGIYPAIKASRLDPINALRYE